MSGGIKMFKLLKKINKKFYDAEQKGYEGLKELSTDLQNKNCKLYCKKCGAFMPFFRMVIKAKGVKIGEKYEMKCRKCKHINILIKGEY